MKYRRYVVKIYTVLVFIHIIHSLSIFPSFHSSIFHSFIPSFINSFIHSFQTKHISVHKYLIKCIPISEMIFGGISVGLKAFKNYFLKQVEIFDAPFLYVSNNMTIFISIINLDPYTESHFGSRCQNHFGSEALTVTNKIGILTVVTDPDPLS